MTTVGISLHISTGPEIWRIPFGFQLVPAGIMAVGLLTVKESPRWLASKGHNALAAKNLAYLRRLTVDHPIIREEMAEIEAAIKEEQNARNGLGLREAFFGKGNFIRFVIAIAIFILQQWSGQNSVNYYAPQIFQSVSSVDGRSLAVCPDSASVVDWLHGYLELAACVRNLRHCQARRHHDLRVLPRGYSRA